MQYPVVYDKKETSFTGLGIGVLENATRIRVREQINGEFTLSFILPANDEKWQYIQEENLVKVYDASQKKDQLFRIRTPEDIRDQQGKLTSNVQCEHVFYESRDCKHIPYYEAIGETPEDILEEAYSGTQFTIGTVEITTPTDIFLDKTNPAAIVAKLIENVGGELIKDNYTIHLVEQRSSSNSAVQFRIGKNIKTIKRTTDSKNVITRLFPYGKDSLEIDGHYIDSPLINNYSRPKFGHKDYKDIEDPEELEEEALKEWSTEDRDGIDKPRVTYQSTVLELKKLKEFGEFEAFGLGDAPKFVDEDLGINTRQRIVEYENDPYYADESSVVLANYSPKIYFENRSSSIMASTLSTTKKYEKVTDVAGKLNPHWFQNIKMKLQTLFNGGMRDAIMHRTGDIWVDDPDNPTKAMGILADGFAIANSKLENGDWDWKTFGTADGFFADLIVAGVLRAINMMGSKFMGETEHSAYIKMGGVSNLGDLSLYRGDTETPIFQIFDDLSALDFLANLSGGALVNFLTTTGSTTSPKGVWNCSVASVSGLEESGYSKENDIKDWVIANFQPL